MRIVCQLTNFSYDAQIHKSIDKDIIVLYFVLGSLVFLAAILAMHVYFQ